MQSNLDSSDAAKSATASNKGNGGALPSPSFFIEVGAGGALTDEGAYPARVSAVIDLGVQPPMPGSLGVPRRQLAVGFELQGATCLDIESVEPPVMYRRFNLSWGVKAELPKLLRAVLGRDAGPGERLSPADWIGRPVMVTVEHKQRADGGTSARIASVTRCTTKALPELTTLPTTYPGVALTSLPEWAQSAISSALHATPPSASDADHGDVPY